MTGDIRGPWHWSPEDRVLLTAKGADEQSDDDTINLTAKGEAEAVRDRIAAKGLEVDDYYTIEVEDHEIGRWESEGGAAVVITRSVTVAA